MTRDEMDALTSDTDNLSEKIRRLHGAGVATGDISRYVERRFQHVYNVLKRAGLVQPGGANRSAASSVSTDAIVLTLGEGGVVTLPRELLDAQQFADGDQLVCRVTSDGLVIMSRERAIEHLREAARARMPEAAGLFDALLAPRRSSEPDQPG